MTKLGLWPRDRDYLAWVTQRIANRAPDFTYLRRWPFSVGQQVLNPIGREIQSTTQQLTEERNNIFLTSINIDLLDRLYRVDLSNGMTFQSEDEPDGSTVFTVPKVYATIRDVEYEITIAKRNDIRSLSYDAIPSRIEDGEESYQYTEVIPRTSISDLASVTPGTPVIDGRLHITLRGNTTWEYRGRDKIFYPKVFIKGETRKGTVVTEAIPVRHNGTFKTVNQWHLIEEVFVSYLDDDAELTVEVLPFDQESELDFRNIYIRTEGVESWRFSKLGDRTWGSTLISEGFTQTLDDIQRGYDSKDTEHEIELTDANGTNVSLLGAAWKPNTNYMFAVDANNLYIYDTRLPYPDCSGMKDYSTDAKMDLYSERWIYARDETAILKTDILDVLNVPWRIRWSLTEPDGSQWYLGIDGSKWPMTVDAWIDNFTWEEDKWTEQRMELLLDQAGVYIVSIECMYSDPDIAGREYSKITKLMLYTPKITPEITIPLPAILRNAEGMAFDDDGKLWVKVAGDILLADVFYDYFLADYGRDTILLRENYASVRVVI